MRRIPSRLSFLTAVTLVALALAAGPVMAQDEGEFAKTMRGAYQYFEGGGLELQKWAEGPVQYIMLPDERQAWGDLDNDDHRRQFIGWFWARRDLDSRDEEHAFRDGFYERVARANQRFSGFPKGWRSDRGRVWITLGQPSGGMRRVNLQSWGRCSAENGEQWIYYTNNMTFQASFGEFQVVFVETRIGQYEICEPNMMGVGGWPLDVRRAMELTNEAVVLDTATEFEPGRSAVASRPAVAVRETIARTEPLEVPMAEWGDDGIAGQAMIPVELPLRQLLFEPGETTLVARLVAEAQMVPLGANEPIAGRQEWTIELGPDDASTIGGGALRTALVIPAPPGGYAVQVRLIEPISGTAWIWEGPIEVQAEGAAVSPPLVAQTLVRLRDAGDVGVIGRATPRVETGKPFFIVAWVRGATPAVEDVTVTVYDAADNAVELSDLQVSWSANNFAGPLVIRAVAPAAVPGDYILRLDVGGGLAPVDARLRIE